MEDATVNKKELCVIIPVHKPTPSADDIISLKACGRHLKNYDCYLIFPAGMNTDSYLEQYPELLLKPVDAKWLSSIEDYNRMKVDIVFYEMFRGYKFMMTYELDAYIFNSNLTDYKVFEYDYIGAPFFEGYLEALPDAPFIKGGNSGFSVRHIDNCIKVLHSFKKYRLHWLLYKNVLSKLPEKLYHSIVYRINKYSNDRYNSILNGDLKFYFEKQHHNEDGVWSQIVPSLFPGFKVADEQVALKFSFEACPEKLLKLNNNKLPLGCHGWPKNKSFWKNYIDINI